ncbi:MAG: RNA polymerase sigma factor [Phycisphaerae bacterium]|nr:RNA polymerase sigma factor [Phycisphaerae bacterium]MDD5381745.1 RNA polymerase sigma factor [Phycisphaerae bacterium]
MRIGNETGVIGLVAQAQCGNNEAMSRLSQQVADRVLPYIQGLTLNHDMAQDVLQETLLEMVKSLSKVETPENFWCWVYRQALGKAQHHFRDRKRQRSILFRVASGLLGQANDESLAGLNYVTRVELSEAVLKAMDKLKMEYRNVLILRCFESLSYAEIADVLDCKELRARVLFFRAKKSLERQLTRGGFGKECLLAGLVLFRILTKPSAVSSATSLVSASVLNVDAFVAIISLASSKIGLLATSLVTLFAVCATTRSVLYAVGVLVFALYVLFWFWLARLYHE